MPAKNHPTPAETAPTRAFDVAIVGAGPAGLNAALVLGRCGREVVVFDSGRPRNGASRALHGFLTRDGTPPLELRELGRSELNKYPTVTLYQNTEVAEISRRPRQFELATNEGHRVHARFLLLATGRIDSVPDKPGFREYYGLGVYHCPYCDGWEHRDKALVAYGAGESGYDLSFDLLVWSKDVTLCSDGSSGFTAKQRSTLRANGVSLVEEPVVSLRGAAGMLAAVTFANREEVPCEAVFFCSDCIQKSPLAANLGCELDASGSVKCDGHAATAVPGLYVAGNVRGGIHLAIVAAAEGAEAAIAINNALHEESLQ